MTSLLSVGGLGCGTAGLGEVVLAFMTRLNGFTDSSIVFYIDFAQSSSWEMETGSHVNLRG